MAYRYVAGGDAALWVSENLTDWRAVENRPSLDSNEGYGFMDYGPAPELFVAAESLNGGFSRSVDGLAWEFNESSSVPEVGGMCYDPNTEAFFVFWADEVYISYDGLNWSYKTLLPGYCSYIGALDGILVATEDLGELYTSTDGGSSWDTVNSDTGVARASPVIKGNGLYLTVGQVGDYTYELTVAAGSSLAGMSRTFHDSSLHSNYANVAFHDGYFYMNHGYPGDYGNIWQSADGVSWTKVFSHDDAVTKIFALPTDSGRVLVAPLYDGGLVLSEDGTTWKKVEVPVVDGTDYVKSMAAMEGSFAFWMNFHRTRPG